MRNNRDAQKLEMRSDFSSNNNDVNEANEHDDDDDGRGGAGEIIWSMGPKNPLFVALNADNINNIQ